MNAPKSSIPVVDLISFFRILLNFLIERKSFERSRTVKI